MYERNALGLAANQVGNPYRIFAMRGSPENFVCFNPRIIDTSDKQIVLEEGCLSYPNLIVKVKRPESIRVRFNTPNGDTITRQFTGMTSRVFQHEYDHLEGSIFYNKANRVHREQAMRKWRKN
jgi:peptide deformylase